MEPLKTKRPADSAYEKILPFSTDHRLRESWINYFGDLRFGKLLEEMDMSAGIIAYKHADGFALDLTIVTAACDRIDLLAPLPSDKDLRIRGRVNHVGNSSMEVGLRLESLIEGVWTLMARAYFIMVARQGEVAAKVHRLELKSEDELRRGKAALRRQERQRRDVRTSLLKQPPDGQESAHLHAVFLQTRTGREAGVCMKATQQSSLLLMHPQNSNIHNKVFGGYIMRHCFEMGWGVAHLFCHRRPLFLCVDHFYFYKPVEIGSMLCFTGTVTFTGVTSFIVEVVAEVIHPMSGTREVTNVSFFTFVAVDEQRRPFPVPKVYPLTYEEGLKYLDGKRRYQAGKEIQAERLTS